MIKQLLVAAALTLGVGAAAMPAQAAKVHIGIGIFPPHHAALKAPVHKWRMSCAAGARLVDRRGFDRVRAVECAGPTYTYRAVRHGKLYRVVVDARRGVIAGVRRV